MPSTVSNVLFHKIIIIMKHIIIFSLKCQIYYLLPFLYTKNTGLMLSLINFGLLREAQCVSPSWGIKMGMGSSVPLTYEDKNAFYLFIWLTHNRNTHRAFIRPTLSCTSSVVQQGVLVCLYAFTSLCILVFQNNNSV